MKTDVITIYSDLNGRDKALQETEKFTEYYHITGKNAMHLRLLTEETFCMIHGIMEEFSGRIPRDVDGIMSLPGAGRKTANVVYSVAFGGNAIAVDTHVFRVSNRIGLAGANDVLKTERQLMEILDESDWSRAHHYIIYLGRSFCKAAKPDCKNCPIDGLCEKKIKR